MRHLVHAVVGTAALALLIVAAGCAATSDAPAPDVSASDTAHDGAAGTKDQEDPGPMPEEDYGDVPAACVAAGIPSAPSQWASVERAPANWPEAPASAALCLTSSTSDANIATFVSSEAWEDTVVYYETALAGVELTRTSGQDTGTGYEQLEGTLEGVMFLVRESDAGFSLVFA